MKYCITFLLCLLSFVEVFCQVDLQSGLKAYYPFNGNDVDISGNNNNPIFNNAILTSDRWGNPLGAYHFNGLDTYIRIPNSPTINSSNTLSICAWVRPTGYFAGPCHGNSIIMKGDQDNLPGNYLLRFDDNFYTNGGNCAVGSPDFDHQNFYGNGISAPPPGYLPYIQTGEWHSVVATFDGNVGKLYIDCELKMTAPQNGQTFTNSYDLFLGTLNNSSFPYWLNGDLDEVRIYDRAINLDEVKALSTCGTIANCNNWLSTPSYGSFINVGDLDIPGNQLTIEATINRTFPYSLGPGDNNDGDVVSKHLDPSNTNYLLRPNHAYITTTNGFFATPDVCPIELNRTYHIAMVYDGSTLKYYRDGFLMSQVPATGNLFQNNFPTRIGLYTGSIIENFLGFTNEVRIWNVARTQVEIQNYMNGSLPNPSAQLGLQGYYTFDNLINKQGNPTWNGTANGNAVINATNPACEFVPDSCSIVPVNGCDNWLNTQTTGQYAEFGDLDIAGDQITVEALINRTTPWNGSYLYAGDVVSKHTGPTNTNYLLRPNDAEITTTNGYFSTPGTCDIELNKTYHVALVYNGTTLKFYRDGFLLSQTPATGALFQNNFPTRIGEYTGAILENFVGYVNEVRIWNVARTQAQLQAFMGITLPNPTTQPGLMAYYSFNDLTNKQGNTAWNGIVNGGATVNSVNPNCDFTPDSCNVIPNVTVSFTAPDTVCMNTPVQVVNTSVGASNYYWSFCQTNFSNAPAATNLGNPSGALNLPVFTEIVKDDAANYHAFIVNNTPAGLVRYDYGTSLLNVPSVTALGNPGGALPLNAEGIRIIRSNGNWVAIIVGGDPASGNPSSLAVFNFGTTITNAAPSGTNWGNVGNMNYPVDLFVFNEAGNWYGYTPNFRSNTVTKLNFGADFSISPTGVNLGNLGSLDQPFGIGEIKDGSNWHLFIANTGSSSLTRLDYGTSLLNAPLATNIGNPGGILEGVTDISFIRLCDGVKAIVTNAGTNTIAQLNFTDILSATPTGNSLGNTGSFNFPHSISQLFRVDNDIYALIPNAGNNTLSRLQFQGCQTIPGSALQTPGSITYTQAGVYNINLVADLGLATQGSYCKQIVVKDCSVTGISNIINDYTPIISADPCRNLFTVENATAYNTGDTVLLIQMKGAVTDTTNTASFGNVLNYKNAGNYEFNYVKNKTGNVIELKNKLTKQYDIPNGKVQMIRVPYYISTSVSSTLTCLPWDGNKGGVLVFNVRDTLNLNANIDVSGNGFRGGKGVNTFQASTNCGQPDYYYPAGSILAALKGESIATMQPDKASGRGSPANGGGGGQDHNSGGGGGSNGSPGGNGGYQWENCANMPFDNRGLGGIALGYTNAANKIYLGGGGGAGHCNNDGFNSDGGNGGGIVIVKCGKIIYNNNSIISTGNDAVNCVPNATFGYCHEGMGGGGAGGTLLLAVSSQADNAAVNIKGGKGADMSGENNGRLGAGGGGAGGVLWINASTLPGNYTVNETGGPNGVLLNIGNDAWGATPGQDGRNIFSLVLPVDTVLFKPNIDSVRINKTGTSCSGFDFHGLGYTNTDPVATWNWNFGDNTTASTQNTSHVYSGSGPYTVHLTITDINGCSDSIITTVSTTTIAVNAGTDTAFCSNGSVSHMLHATTTGTGYSWMPAGSLNNASLQNPTATVSATTTFYLTAGNLAGCTAIDSVKITVNPIPLVTTINDIAICKRDSVLLTSNSNASTIQWLPATAVNNPGSLSPYFIDTLPHQMIVTGTNSGTGCFSKDTVNISIKPLPVIRSINDTALCGPHNVTLFTTGAQTYIWSPASNLATPGTANPVFTGSVSQTYIVTGTAINGCKAKDTVAITVNAQPQVSTINDITICRGDQLQLLTSSDAQSTHWAPASSVNNANLPSPNFTDTISQQMVVTGTNTTGCSAKDTINITVKPIPTVLSLPDSAMCGAHAVALVTTGAQSYSWNPATNLSNPGIASPIFSGTAPQVYLYVVTGTAANFCKSTDTVKITVNSQPFVTTIGNLSICRGDSLLLASTTDAQSVHWQPSSSVNNPVALSPYFTGMVSQQLIVTGANSSGCLATDTVNITVKPLPVVNTIADTAFCGSASVVLTTTGAQSYSWSPAFNLSDPATGNPLFSTTTAQVYHYIVTGTGSNSCRATDSVKITLNPNPLISTITGVSICRGDALLLTSTSNSQTVHWTPAGSVSNANITSPAFTDTISQNLTITGTNNSSGCTSTANVSVTVKPLPVVKTIPDFVSCATTTVTLTTTGAQTYSWTPAAGLNNTSASSPIFTGTGNHTFIVTGTGANGCVGKDTVHITIAPKPIFGAPQDKTVCAGQPAVLNGNNGPAYQYSWSPAASLSNAGIVDPVANPSVTTIYTLLIRDQLCNYDSTFLVTVTVHGLPDVVAGKSNDIDCAFPESHLTASGASEYSWSPASGLNNAFVYDPVASPDLTTVYVVKGTDNNGCSNNDTLTLFVKGGKYHGFHIPNSFTPNGDNLNDCFGVPDWGTTQNFMLVIYNRWGQKVFETTSVNDCWDGNYRGQPADPGNYAYFLKGETLCGNITRKGNVLLIR